MAEEVKIHISEDGADATRAKIQELYKAAAAYESKGIDTAAKSARADAKALEGDLAKLGKERAVAQKEITREMAAQTARVIPRPRAS